MMREYSPTAEKISEVDSFSGASGYDEHYQEDRFL